MSDLPFSFFTIFHFFHITQLHASGGRQSIIQQAVVERFLANGGGRFCGFVGCINGKPEASKKL
jgi:hypothetical protein